VQKEQPIVLEYVMQTSRKHVPMIQNAQELIFVFVNDSYEIHHCKNTHVMEIAVWLMQTDHTPPPTVTMNVQTLVIQTMETNVRLTVTVEAENNVMILVHVKMLQPDEDLLCSIYLNLDVVHAEAQQQH
jgi:hypothetical protein